MHRANRNEGSNHLSGAAEQFLRRLSPADNFVARLVQEIVQRARTCWSRMVCGAIGIDLNVFILVLLNVGKCVEDNEQPDYDYECQDDGESLAHRQSVPGLQGGDITRAEILPIVR